MMKPPRVTAIAVSYPFRKSILHSVVFGLIFGALLISSGCRFPTGGAGEELENVPGAYTFTQGSTDYPHLYQKAVEYLEKNEYSQAETVYREIIAEEPDEINGYIGLGTSLNLQGRQNEAREAYEGALAIAPDSVEALVGLAAAYVGQGLFPQAVETYRQALVLDPQDANAHYGLATVLVALDEIEEARAHFEMVIELAPRSGLAAEASRQIEALGQGEE